MSLKMTDTLPFVGSVMSSHSKLVRKSLPMLVWLMLYDPARTSGDRHNAESTVGSTMVGFMT